MTIQEIKQKTGKAAVEALVKSGMKIGLGTGSTALYVIQHLGLLVQQGVLHDIAAVPTSFQSAQECYKSNIPVYSLDSPRIKGRLDLSIDGADEVDRNLFCIKGGGGALLLEKIIAYNSDAYCLVVDKTKCVENLGLVFPVPLELVPEARVPVTQALERRGLKVTLREAVRKVGPVITEHGNILLDVLFPEPVNPVEWESAFVQIAGVVESGFFTKTKPAVFVGSESGEVDRLCL
ncbi:MAG: ribose-5-phosphate isomerase RpiA [Spirochaetaceae bacterium]|jgi:ribose 5-phosphate isomerase A|nr:ribose-5-phosphate isomerase RpiA [Spirochaetaceae bacterium]